MNALKIGSLFSGIGGLDMAVEQFFNATTAWHCEWDEEPSKVLAARWPGIPNHRDVTTVDWAAVEPVDIMCGGFPCQDVSLAGRRAGMKEGTRSGLWSEFARAIDIVRPKVVVIENVRGLISADAGGVVEPCPWCVGDGADEYRLRALDAVVADLSDLGFDAEWTGLRAADVGAPHGRFRFFLVAYAQGFGFERGWPARRGWAGSSNSDRGDVILLPTPTVQDSSASGGSNEYNVTLTDAVMRTEFGTKPNSRLLPTPRAARGASGTETMYRLGAERDDTGDRQGNVTFRNGETSGQESEAGPDQDVRGLRSNDGAQAVREPIGGSNALPDTEDVLAEVRERSSGRPSGYTPMEGEETSPPNDVRGMRGDAAPARTSHRPEPIEQRSGELGEPLSAMPHEEALGGRSGVRVQGVQWGDYADAVNQWETILGRPAPAPTLGDGRDGNHRLNAEFVSWMMGYPLGWVTDILRRNPAIKACGNGVVPQQAFAALSILWPRVLKAVAS